MLKIGQLHEDVLHASGAETATGNSAAASKQSADVVTCDLDVTAASGTTPTLDITIQESIDKVNWYSLGTFTQATGVTNEQKKFADPAPYIRGLWTIGGTTPSFTFTLKTTRRTVAA